MNLLALIPLRAWLELGALGVILGAGFWWTAHERHLGYEKGKAEIQAQWAKQIALESKVAAEETARNEAETQRRIAEQERIAHDAALQALSARADADAARAAHGRLQQQLAAYLAADRQSRRDPAPVSGSAPATDPIGLLADLFSLADARAGELAQAADDARVAGQACERSYDALSR